MDLKPVGEQEELGFGQNFPGGAAAASRHELRRLRGWHQGCGAGQNHASPMGRRAGVAVPRFPQEHERQGQRHLHPPQPERRAVAGG
ncbi:hypothetical protein [Chroococcidiopsis sp. SAG 2025]|uniref:hypothetical protein n=1 Tax=Chroococcidiopsis sp. SAG 2025 TaxID=171389 RepID=UPI002936FBE6|nr:hypothetical protein [Chroococcidiopsis sp. SAG 2025]